MTDVVMPAMPAIPEPTSTATIPNGVPTNPEMVSQPMSREPSLPAKMNDQLNLEPEMSSTPESEDSSETGTRVGDLLRLPALPYSSMSTGLCYDPRMRFHTELNPPLQRSDFHPEDPRRILAIYQTLCYSGLYEDPVYKAKNTLVPNQLLRLGSRYATKEEISLVHHAEHFDFLRDTAGLSCFSSISNH
jgi:histone deacetylase 6